MAAFGIPKCTARGASNGGTHYFLFGTAPSRSHIRLARTALLRDRSRSSSQNPLEPRAMALDDFAVRGARHACQDFHLSCWAQDCFALAFLASKSQIRHINSFREHSATVAGPSRYRSAGVCVGHQHAPTSFRGRTEKFKLRIPRSEIRSTRAKEKSRECASPMGSARANFYFDTHVAFTTGLPEALHTHIAPPPSCCK